MNQNKLSYYFFVMLDLTSKYLLFTKLKHRSATNIIYGLSKILKQIRQYKESMATIKNSDDKLIFFSDILKSLHLFDFLLFGQPHIYWVKPNN